MGLSTTVFQALPCDDFENGDRRLSADLSIGCDTPRYETFRGVAFASTAVFVVGQPVCLLVLLFLGKKYAGGNGAGAIAAACRVLSEDFRKGAFFMHPLQSLQKVSIAGVLVFTDANFTQTLTGKMISIFWFGVLTLIAPYHTTGENLCAFVLNLSVCVIMVGGVATKVLALQVALAQITDAAFETLIDPDFADAVPWTAMAVSLVSFVVALAREVAYGPCCEKDDEEDPPPAGGGGAAAAVHPIAPEANTPQATGGDGGDPAHGEPTDARARQLERDVADRDRTITMLKGQMLDFEQQAKDAHKAVTALRRTVADQKKTNADMRKKLAALEAREKAAAHLEATIATQQATIAAHEKTIADMAKKLAEFETTTTERHHPSMVEHDAAVAQPDRTVTESAVENEEARHIKPAPSQTKRKDKKPKRTLEA